MTWKGVASITSCSAGCCSETSGLPAEISLADLVGVWPSRQTPEHSLDEAAALMQKMRTRVERNFSCIVLFFRWTPNRRRMLQFRVGGGHIVIF